MALDIHAADTIDVTLLRLQFYLFNFNFFIVYGQLFQFNVCIYSQQQGDTAGNEKPLH